MIFFLLRNVVTKQNLPVALALQLADDLPNDFRSLSRQHLVKLIRGRIGNVVGAPDFFPEIRPFRPADVSNCGVPCDATNESGETFGLPKISSPELLENDPEGLLGKVFSNRLISNDIIDYDGDSAFVAPDDLVFRRRVPRGNSTYYVD
ncbi:MAG TPA: hypothetical protein VN937_25640 [Blastocatellia bacterium]|nr:hypothetical protein [Blastocatellia bacterium]